MVKLSQFRVFRALLTCRTTVQNFDVIFHDNMVAGGTYSKSTISCIIILIIRSYKKANTLETFFFQIKLVLPQVKILSEGIFSHVVAHMFSLIIYSYRRVCS